MVPLVTPPVNMHIFLLFLVLTCTTTTTTGATVNHHHRRMLHQPFFPQVNPTLPPAQPPTQPPATLPPLSSPPSLNVPFLTTPGPTTSPPDDHPFFQTFPSPPPPPSTTTTTPTTASFPANISSLSLPTSPKPKPSSKLVPIAIALSVVAIIILSVVLALKIKKRKTNSDDSQSFSDEKLPNDGVFSSAVNNNGNNSYNRIPKLNRPSQTSSEFLYLGTLVNSHGGGVDAHGNNNNNNNNNNNININGDREPTFEKVGSPELRPLPPLSGNIGRSQPGFQTTRSLETTEASGDEAFDAQYSPEASAGGRTTAEAGPHDSRRSVGSASSSFYSSSSSGSPARSISLSTSPPVSLSPRNSRMKSPDLVAVHTAPPPTRPAPPPPPPPRHLYTIPSPEVGLSKDSLESSPRLSNSSNDQNFAPFKIPPPPPPTNHPDITPPAARLNPPVLIKPSRHVLPVNQENLEMNEKTLKPKLKALHWDKVRASSDREMVWDHLKSSSFKLNEEMIETLFVVKPQNPSNLNEKSPVKRPILPLTDRENQVLDPKKSQNISIALRALNVTTEEVCDALLEGNVGALRIELLESLLKMVPTKEEERKLKDYCDDLTYKLGPAEKFLKAVLDVPFAFRRIGAMLYVSNFDSEVEYLKSSFQTLEAACEELRNNRMFLKLLEAVLKTGNRMNIGTNRGDAEAFKLDTLLKLIDVKGADGKTTLLHFVVKEIVRTEGARHTNPNTNQAANGLQTISNLCSDLSNVKKAAAMDSEALKADVVRLSNGIANTIDVVKLMESTKFSDSMSRFLNVAQQEVTKIQVQESETLCLVKEITEYFHGNSAKEEAHPLRIFMVVRDFLTVLDIVCKEVGMLSDRMMVSSVHKFPVPVNPTPVFDGFHGRGPYSSSDDESSCSL